MFICKYVNMFIYTEYEDGTDSIPKPRDIKFIRRGITPKMNTAFRTRRKFPFKYILI